MKTMFRPKEYAPVINFRKMPVVRLDVSQRDEYGLTGAPVLIDNGFHRDGEPYRIRARIRSYSDEVGFSVVRGPGALSNIHTYKDMEEDLLYANAPIIKPGEEFVMVLVDCEKRRFAYPIVVKAGDTVSAFCITPLKLETVEWRRFVDDKNTMVEAIEK